MVIIYGMLIVFFIIMAYSIFQNMLTYSKNQGTQYLIIWFFSLLFLNLLIMFGIYSYYYYKTTINPYRGRPGLQGMQGREGSKGSNTVECSKKPEYSDVKV